MPELIANLDSHLDWIVGFGTTLVVLAGLVKLFGRRVTRIIDDVVGAVQTLVGRDAIIDKRTKMVVSEAREGIGTIVERMSDGLVTLTDSVDGLAKTVDMVNRKVQAIEHEVQFNNGGSIKDATVRTEEAVTQLTKDVSRLTGDVYDLRTQICDIGERLHTGDEKFAALEAVLTHIRPAPNG